MATTTKFRLKPEPPLPSHRNRIAEMSRNVKKALGNKDPILVCVLKGAFMFVADLARQLDFPFSIDFLRASSYGDSVVTSGEVRMELDLQQSISNRHVLIVEDIIDTGLTVKYLKANLETRNPASVRVCTLLHKPANNVKLAPLDFCGFEIPNHFVVGYGLDWQGYYRNLPYVAQVHEISD